MATEDHPPGPTDTDDDLDFLVPANSQPVRRGDTEVVKRSKQIANGLHKRQEAVENNQDLGRASWIKTSKGYEFQVKTHNRPLIIRGRDIFTAETREDVIEQLDELCKRFEQRRMDKWIEQHIERYKQKDKD